MTQKNEAAQGIVVPGRVYRHFKGNLYKVLEVARHSETGVPMVVYQALYGDYGLWVRPLEMFLETVEVAGARVPRFERHMDGMGAETVPGGEASEPCVRMLSDPVEDLNPPPDLHQLILETGGQRRFGVMFTPGGTGKLRPTLLLLHGFPGNERNFDLAHAVRRLGWNVMIFHYRGTWGSDGTFTFENALEDIRLALAWLRSEKTLREYQVDSSRLFIGGNSFGGFAAVLAAEEDSDLKGVIALSVYDLGRMGALIREDARAEAEMLGMFANCVIPTSGGSAQALRQEVLERQPDWDISGKASRLKGRPVLLLAGARDLDGPAEVHYEPLRAAMEEAGVLLEAHLLDSDHGFQNKRIEVACRIGRFLEKWNQVF